MRILRFLLVLGILVVPPPAGAQQAGKVAKIGFLIFPSVRPGWAEPLLPTELVRRAVRELGYFEDQNVTWNARSSSSRDFLPQLAADLVQLKAEVIVASGAEAIQAAKDSTKTIPIVMLSFADPIAMRFVTSLARPGGNVTGVSLMTADLGEKRLALLKEALPRPSRVAVLWNPTDATATYEWTRLHASAHTLGLTLVSLECRTPQDVEAAFATARKSRLGALVVAMDPLTYAQGSQIVSLAAKNRLPAMYGSRTFVERGGLMAYQPSNKEAARRVAVFVDKILKGAKPGDLPVEQPSEFELVVNMKTAQALGLKIPPSVLVLAEQIFR
ncbi:MAG: ABC transporter substrate-binding protein [Candidatus Rokubacteria bacterium]|nr:ABC transporter substrate-binding protein [Candidatus Rokubacteria bacterium]